INDKPITSYNQLLEEIRARSAGDKVKIKILREGQPQEIELTLAERPPGQGGSRRAAPQQSAAFAGINGEEAEGGVRLTNVIENGPAAKAGLKAGDIVIAVEEKPIDKYEELVEMIRARKPG